MRRDQAIAIPPQVRNYTGLEQNAQAKRRADASSDGIGIAKKRRVLAESDDEDTPLLSQDSTVLDASEPANDAPHAPLRQKAKATRVPAPGFKTADQATDTGVEGEIEEPESADPFLNFDSTVPFSDLDAAVHQFQSLIADRYRSIPRFLRLLCVQYPVLTWSCQSEGQGQEAGTRYATGPSHCPPHLLCCVMR